MRTTQLNRLNFCDCVSSELVRTQRSWKGTSCIVSLQHTVLFVMKWSFTISSKPCLSWLPVNEWASADSDQWLRNTGLCRIHWLMKESIHFRHRRWFSYSEFKQPCTHASTDVAICPQTTTKWWITKMSAIETHMWQMWCILAEHKDTKYHVFPLRVAAATAGSLQCRCLKLSNTPCSTMVWFFKRLTQRRTCRLGLIIRAGGAKGCHMEALSWALEDGRRHLLVHATQSSRSVLTRIVYYRVGSILWVHHQKSHMISFRLVRRPRRPSGGGQFLWYFCQYSWCWLRSRRGTSCGHHQHLGLVWQVRVRARGISWTFIIYFSSVTTEVKLLHWLLPPRQAYLFRTFTLPCVR